MSALYKAKQFEMTAKQKFFLRGILVFWDNVYFFRHPKLFVQNEKNFSYLHIYLLKKIR